MRHRPILRANVYRLLHTHRPWLPVPARTRFVVESAARPLLLTGYTSQEVCIEANGSLAPMQ